MGSKITTKQELNEFVLYTSPNGEIKVEVLFNDETIWATQDKIGQLFETTKQNVSQHLANIFKEGELVESSVVKKFFTTASDGKKYQTKFGTPNLAIRTIRQDITIRRYYCEKLSE